MTKAERKADAKQAYAALMKFYPLTLEDLDGEEWADITGYEGLYQVSNFGRVKSFWKYKHGKLLRPAVDKYGYLYVALSNNVAKRKEYLHRLVAKNFLTIIGGKTEVNHIDGHPLNCYVENLEWVTRAENSRHAHKMGLCKSGEDNKRSKLINSQIKSIRENVERLSCVQLAKKFNVGIATISRIQLGKTYKNATGTIRGKIENRISNDIRNEIRRLYVRNSREYGAYALSKKFGISRITVQSILKGK